MDDVQFQLREQRAWAEPEAPRQYPIPFDERVKEGDQFRLSEETLSATLRLIENYYSSLSDEAHTGTSGCARCQKHQRQIWQAYYDYYLGTEPDRWDIRLQSYRQEIRDMMNSIPDRYTLEDVNARFEKELREHLAKDLCTFQPDLDSMDLMELKRLTFQGFQAGKPTSRLLEERLDAELNTPTLHSSDAVAFIEALQGSKNPRQRIQIYQKYYCTPAWDDSSHMKNLKAKYSKLFETGMSHDSVLAKWKKEALAVQEVKISKLKHRMGELKMAQSAHLKNKAKKAEKDQRLQDREYVFVQRQNATCSLERCERVVNLADEGVQECAVCSWLAGKDRTEQREHAYYCSEDHVEEDFEYHDRHEHSCVMTSYCIFDPEPGPEETGQGGICPDCMDNGILSYFCSQDCYQNNLELHCEMTHYPKDIQSRSDDLEIFKPASDLEIVSS